MFEAESLIINKTIAISITWMPFTALKSMRKIGEAATESKFKTVELLDDWMHVPATEIDRITDSRTTIE